MDKIFLFVLIQISISLPLIPVSKFILSDNVNNMKFYDLRYDITGTYLTFDKEAEFSFLPYEIYSIIENYATGTEEIDCDAKKIEINGVQYQAFWCGEISLNMFDDINLITEKYSIKIPSSEFFVDYNERKYFRFVSSKNVEHIVLDKVLINFMNIKFLDNDDYIIQNKNCTNEFKD